MAETILKNNSSKTEWVKGTLISPQGTTLPAKPIQPYQLPIDSIRQGEVPGIHEVDYNSAFDKISISHSAHNREGFALGAVLAAEFTYTHEGLLTMDDLFHDL